MNYWHIDTDTLGPVLLRRAPSWAVSNEGVPVVDRKTGEPLAFGELLLPGVAPGRRGATRPAAIRIRCVGGIPDALTDQQLVVLAGKVTVTTWYNPGRGGAPGTSEVTVSAEHITPAPTGTLPSPDVLRGLLPIKSPSPSQAPWWLVDIYKPELRDAFVAVLSAPADVVSDTGSIEVDLAGAHDIGLIGQLVDLVDARARIIVPDQRDVGRTLKSELAVTVGELRPAASNLVAATNGAGPAKARRDTPPADTSAGDTD